MNSILQMILKRIGLLIAITVATVVLAVLMYSNFTVERYEASAVMLVDNSTDTGGYRTYEDLLASQRLAEYFGMFFHSEVYREDLIKDLDMTDDEYNSLMENVQVSIKKDTGIVTVTLHNGAKADTIESLESISSIMMKKFTDLTGVRNIRIIRRVQSEEAMQKGLLPVIILAGLLGGLLISSLIVVIVEKSSGTIKSAEDAAKQFNIPVLGVIPRFKEERSGHNAREFV